MFLDSHSVFFLPEVLAPFLLTLVSAVVKGFTELTLGFTILVFFAPFR